MGPRMLALKDARRQKFAYLMACGELSATEAARRAGYSDVAGGCKQTSGYLMHNDKVLDAIEEATRNILRGLAPLAVRKARAILDDGEHPQHARMIETVLDRTGHFARTEHTVKVQHSMDTKELEDLALKLAKEAGIDPSRLIGVNSSVQIEGKRDIDGSFSVLNVPVENRAEPEAAPIGTPVTRETDGGSDGQSDG